MDQDDFIDDEISDELARIHDEVIQQKTCQTVTDQEQNAARPETNEASTAGLGRKLHSARKVIELLHSLKPTVSDSQGLFDTAQSPSLAFSQDESTAYVSSEAGDLPSFIGRFEVRKLLGKGGFGLVFEAYDPTLDRLVALKVPTFTSLIESDARARFQRESRLVAALRHPNILPVFEVGNDGPISFIASEYIAGTDLARWVAQRGVLTPDNAAMVLARIADAVQHAHHRGVIHRDLKPANILVADSIDASASDADVDPASVCVADFGLAKMLGEPEKELTQTGHRLGTPAFSAPEQMSTRLQAEQSPWDGRVDVYSLGAILYYLLTGAAPFQSETLLGILSLVEKQEPKLPSSIPTDLAAICCKAMQKLPNDRYATAYELSCDLHKYLDGRPTIARPVSSFQRLVKTMRRNPVVAALSSVTVFAIFLGSGLTLWSARQASVAAQQTRQQYLDSKQVVDDYFVKVSRDPLFMSSAFEQQKLDLLATAKEHYAAFLVDNADDDRLVVDWIRTRIYISDAELEGDQLSLAEAGYTEALEQLDQELAVNPASSTLIHLQALAQLGLGLIDGKRGDYQSASDNLHAAEQAMDLQGEKSWNEPEWIYDRVRLYRACFQHHRAVGQNEAANDYSIKQQAVLESVPEILESNPVLRNFYAMALGDQSYYYRDAGQLEKALTLLDQSLEVSQQLVDTENHPVWYAEVASLSFYRRGVIHVRAGQLERAMADARKASRLFAALAIHNRTAAFLDQRMSVRNLLAICLEQTGQPQEALALTWENLEDARWLVKQFPDQVEFQISLATQLFQLASALTDNRNLDEARRLSEELENHLERLQADGLQHPMIASLSIANCSEKGRLLHRSQEFEEAIKEFDQAGQLADRVLKNDPQRPDILGVLQTIYDNRSLSHVQLENYQQAISDRRESMALDNSSPAYQQLALAEVLAIAGDIEAAGDVLADLNQQDAKQELSASEVEMKLALIHGAIAVELQRRSQPLEAGANLDEAVKTELELAESHFLNADSLGYFDKRPYAYQSIVMRSHLAKLFRRPVIGEILERQRLIWESRQ